MIDAYRIRRIVVTVVSAFLFIAIILINTPNPPSLKVNSKLPKTNISSNLAIKELNTLTIKGRAPKTGYTREQFGVGWMKTKGCDTRNIILNRDLSDVAVDENCNVVSGVLNDPYTGKIIQFKRGSETSGEVQIDHVVALSDAWQKGAFQFTLKKRIELANDPLELLAVSGASNLQKSDGDAATWLPSNKSFRCQYVARQIAVKQKYMLWITSAEHDAMENILIKCPNQLLPRP